MSFTADLSRFTKRAADDVAHVRNELILRLFSSIVIGTPVQDGVARGNWRISAGTPIKDIIDRADKSGELVRREIIEALRVHRDDLDSPLFLSNNLPYIEPLENGSSTQAPEGMVKVNFALIPRMVQRINQRKG